MQTGENVLIGGFIVNGEGSQRVLIRAIGPSLAGSVANPLSDTTLTLYDAGGSALVKRSASVDPVSPGLAAALGLELEALKVGMQAPSTVAAAGPADDSAPLIEGDDDEAAAAAKNPKPEQPAAAAADAAPGWLGVLKGARG